MMEQFNICWPKHSDWKHSSFFKNFFCLYFIFFKRTENILCSFNPLKTKYPLFTVTVITPVQATEIVLFSS